jgi:hypothetical protein
MDGQPSGGFEVRQPGRGAFGRDAPGIGKPLGGTVRSVKAAFEFILRGLSRKHVQAGMLIKASSGLTRGCVWIGWTGKSVRRTFGFRGIGWKGPRGRAVTVRFPLGRGSTDTRPLEQQAFECWSLETDLRIWLSGC